MNTSIRWRFAVSLGANLARAFLSFLTGMLLARWLGPDEYGNMAFLLGTFLAARQLLDMGSSSAFFTFLSQRARSRRFVGAFFLWLGVQFLVPIAVIGLLMPAAWLERIWHGEDRLLLLLAFAAAFMQNSVWPVVQQAGESQRRTIRMQVIGVAISVAHLVAVGALMWLGALGLYAVFAVIAVEYLLASVLAQRGFPYADDKATAEALGQGMYGGMFQKYWRYCVPLILYSVVGFAYDFSDRWLLQSFGGSVEQAYYAVSAQFAAIALIATTSILRIFWKEIAEAHERKDHQRTGMVYQKVSRMLFWSGACIAGFFVPWSEEIIGLLLGAAYSGGSMTLAIMFLYPVHQSMGQLGGTLLLATEKVSVQVYSGIVFMILSIGASYIALAPPDALLPGLGLASQGLALKMFIMQLIQVNVVAYIIARIWKWPFDWWFQPISMGGCLILGWLAKQASAFVVGEWVYPLFAMGVAGGAYLVAVAGFVFLVPDQAGVSRSELIAAFRFVRDRLYLIFPSSGKD